MAFVDIPITELFSMASLSSANHANHTINNSSLYRAAYYFRVPKSGTVTAIVLRTAAMSGSPQLAISLENISPTTGFPDNTVYGGAAFTTGALAANSTVEKALSSNATVTKGDYVALVFTYSSGTSAQIGYVTSHQVSSIPSIATYNLGTFTWTKVQGVGAIALKYNDESYETPIGALPANYAGNTTSLSCGIRWKQPFAAKICGGRFAGQIPATTDVELKLFADNGTLIATSPVYDGNIAHNTLGWNTLRFNSEHEISADTWYRLHIAPTTVANVTYREAQSVLAGTLIESGAERRYSQVSGGVWSDQTTKVPLMTPLISAVHASDGGGGGGGAWGTMF